MDGVLYARDASTGAPLWHFAAAGPIRHAPAVMDGLVLTGSQDGYTYALDAANGTLRWKTHSGPSASAPLLDVARHWVYVGTHANPQGYGSPRGQVMALRLADGAVQWAMPCAGGI